MKVLFVGNSHTYYNAMPFLFLEMMNSQSHEKHQVAMLATPGESLEWHSKQIETQMNISHGNWDAIVLQQRTHPFPGKENLFSSLTALQPFFQKTQAQVTLYLTWAEKAYPQNQDVLTEAFKEAGEKFSFPVVAVGEVFRKIRHTHPEFPLFAEDHQHASPQGSYLAACAFYTHFSKKTPVGLPELIISKDEAKFIQENVWEVIKPF